MRKNIIVLILGVIFLGLVARLWWHFSASKFPGADVNPYEQYTLVMQTPSPSSQISELVRDLEKISRISGWTVLSWDYNGDVASVKLKADGGAPAKLLTATQAMKMSANFSPSGVVVNFGLGLDHRNLSDKMLDAQETADEIIKNIGKIISPNDIKIDHTEKNRVFKKIDMSVNLNNISYSQLQAIGEKLGDAPAKINLLSAEVNNKTQKLTGVLKISVVGS